MSRKKEENKRVKRVSFLLNDQEMEAFETYCRKYRIPNRSQHVRETIIKTILTRFDKDYPSLFQQLREKSGTKKGDQPEYVQGVLFSADSF